MLDNSAKALDDAVRALERIMSPIGDGAPESPTPGCRYCPTGPAPRFRELAHASSCPRAIAKAALPKGHPMRSWGPPFSLAAVVHHDIEKTLARDSAEPKP